MWKHRLQFCVAGVAWRRAWFPFVAVHAAAVCVAGMALGDIDLHFVWPAVALMALGWLWWRAWFLFGAVDAAAVCVAGVAFGSIDLHSVWQASHFATSTCTLCGRRDIMALGWLWRR